MAETILAAFTRLCEQRDLAAYRVVGALDQAIHYCKRGETAYALSVLTEARTQYELADVDLENFKRANLANRKDEPVRRTAAAA